jgi:hypothetical protein
VWNLTSLMGKFEWQNSWNFDKSCGKFARSLKSLKKNRGSSRWEMLSKVRDWFYAHWF